MRHSGINSLRLFWMVEPSATLPISFGMVVPPNSAPAKMIPKTLPKIAGLDLAAYYATSRYAGGDYYDFRKLPDGRIGILVADAEGHSSPATVLMSAKPSLTPLFLTAASTCGVMFTKSMRFGTLNVRYSVCDFMANDRN